MAKTGFGSFSDAVRAFRPETDPTKFAEAVPFRIRSIRAYARKLSGVKEITDYQIILVCWKAKLLRTKRPRRGALLEDLTETALLRVEKWLRAQVFAKGYDDYFKEVLNR
jgi:hypothetical protein